MAASGPAGDDSPLLIVPSSKASGICLRTFLANVKAALLIGRRHKSSGIRKCILRHYLRQGGVIQGLVTGFILRSRL